MTHKVFWSASLSNGETLFENKGDYVEVVGELSPYNKLLKYCDDNCLDITSMSLYTDDGRTFNLPSSGQKPRFKEFQDIEKPYKYSCFRKAGADMNSDFKVSGANLFTVVEAVYFDYRVQLWVDEYNTKNCWCLIVRESL